MQTTAVAGEPLTTTSATRRSPPRWLPDVLALVWTIAAGVAVLAPALIHASHLGPFDLLSHYGLSAQPGVTIHNTTALDQIDAIQPWVALSWTQVHSGHLPLWDPFGGLGTPLAFNLQSAPFGLPALVGYLFPLQYAATVGVIVTVVIAGTGAYVFGRLIHLTPMAAAFGATVFELSGAFIGWLGWPHAAVAAWTGWLLAAGLLIVRGRHRFRSIVALAVVLALAAYCGQPEILIMLVITAGIFLLSVLGFEARRHGLSSTFRPLGDLVIAAITAGALAAPFLLPGFQFVSQSIRNSSSTRGALPLHYILFWIFQGYDGLPKPGQSFPGIPFYNGNYLGVIALVLAAVGLIVRRRRSEVAALAVVAFVIAAILYVPFVIHVVDKIPLVGTVLWQRAVLMFAFAVAALAGVGADVLLRSGAKRYWTWAMWGFVAIGLLIILLSFFALDLPNLEKNIRERSFIWPVVETLIGFAITAAVVFWVRSHSMAPLSGGLRSQSASVDFPSAVAVEAPHDSTARVSRRGRMLAISLLLVAETAFLVTVGAALWWSSPSFYPSTAAEAKLEHIVGSSRVGVNGPPTDFALLCWQLGILPDVNDVYGVHELNVYDPALPSDYFSSWSAVTGEPGGDAFFNTFCPAVSSAALARRFGVPYILEPLGENAPRGTVYVARVGNESLFRVPGAGEATETDITPDGQMPGPNTPGRAIAVGHSSPSTWHIVTDARTAEALRLHLSNVPGWNATIDGKPLQLTPYSGMMLQARIPSGHHVIEVSYWPRTFTEGLIIFVVAVVALAAAGVVVRRRQRKGQAVDVVD
jgi:hypothetical protein